MHKITLKIDGMTCINCQTRIENALLAAAGIKSAKVSWQDGKAEIEYDEKQINLKEIKKIIETLDYKVRGNVTGKSDRTGLLKEIYRSIFYVVIITLLFILLQKTGLLNLLSPGKVADSKMSYALLFVTGLFTSVHCIAMCGGINLSQSIGGKTAGLKYNAGRVLSYTLIGLILGTVGFFLARASKELSSDLVILPFSLQSILKLIAGFFMILMGISLLGIFPVLRKITPHLPAGLSKKIYSVKYSAQKKHRGAFIVGLLNGFMPCGPLQAMWIVALASGNPLSGALSMLFFSLGTVPLMLGLSSIISLIGKKYTGVVMKIGSILVVVMGLSMVSQGFALGGKKADSINSFEKKVLEANNDKQIIKSKLSAGKYPNITVKKGIPVQWEIEADENSLTGCNYRMILKDFKLGVELGYGTNVIEFTPEKAGNFQYSCWMGMITGTIKVEE